MKALILVGGFGTRLRPLTLTLPKPLVEFANQPIILHQIEALVKVGVKDIVLAVNYKPELMVQALESIEKKYNIRITFSVENEPLGTAGPLALAADVLLSDESPFFVFNSDVICSFPLQDMIDFHKAHGAEGSILVTKVEEPSKYGVVVLKEDDHHTTTMIDRFVEKPQVYVGNRINAGIYLFNPSILKRIPLKPTSVEKEIFPKMAQDHQLHAMDLKGFWMDIGQPKDYLHGLRLYLNSLPAPSESSATFKGAVIVHETAKIGKGCLIGPNVSIAENVVIGDGTRLKNCAVFRDAVIGSHAWIDQSIIGWGSKLGQWTRLENVCVLGEKVEISDEAYVNGGCILPHKTISKSIPEPQIII